MKPHHSLYFALLLTCVAPAGPTMAQVSLQGAHDQGMNLGKEQNNSVGTSRISEQTASQIPLYKPNAVQSGNYDGGFGDMMGIGVDRINQSKTYSPGSCDREGFNPEQAAQSVMGPAKWAALTPVQKQQAISDQVSFFDQECEGINFLAGEYQMRQKIEIPPDDNLADWTPPAGTPDGNGECTTKDISIPAEYIKESCYQTTALEKRECFETANVNVYMKPGLPDKDVYKVLNANTPTWKLTFHPADLTISVYGVGYRWQLIGDLDWQRVDVEAFLGLISMSGGHSAVVPYGNESHRIESYSVGDGCSFRINSRHTAGGAGPGDIHAYWILNLCEPTRHVDVTWQDNCAILESATDLPN